MNWHAARRSSEHPGPIRPIWWSQTGSNRRPHACKARALPTELWPHIRRRRVCLLWQTRGAGFAPAGRGRPNAPPRSSGALSQGRERRPPALEALTKMVGLGRLERPTSPLSGVRSNQLSYRPAARDAPAPRIPATARHRAQRLIREERETRTAKSRKTVPDWDLCVPSVPIGQDQEGTCR